MGEVENDLRQNVWITLFPAQHLYYFRESYEDIIIDDKKLGFCVVSDIILYISI